MTDIIEFPRRWWDQFANRRRQSADNELAEMRCSLLAVLDDHEARERIALLAERVADILGDLYEITDRDRQSLLWHLSLIRELAINGPQPLCGLPRFRKDPPPDAS